MYVKMNPYHRMKFIPDSQPLFTEAEENTVFNTEDDKEESQSLISPKKRHSNEVLLRANSEIFFNGQDLPDRQPLFAEAEKYLVSDTGKDHKDTRRKRQIDNILNTDKESQSLIITKNPRSHDVNSSALKIESDNRYTKVSEANSNIFSSGQETKSDTDSVTDLKNGDNMPSKTCTECIFDKELDKRNYYFGNLLIGELQFLPPCMRSEAYVTILKYVDSLKQQHRKKVNN